MRRWNVLPTDCRSRSGLKFVIALPNRSIHRTSPATRPGSATGTGSVSSHGAAQVGPTDAGASVSLTGDFPVTAQDPAAPLLEVFPGALVQGTLSPVQEAFIETSAFQCGFCTPGFVLMVTQLLDEHPDPSDDQIKHYLTGNLCRCATYPEVMDAVRLAAKKRKASAAV